MDTALIDYDHYLPEGESLFDYQHVGVLYALLNSLGGKGCFICDEQGLGKTRQAIVTAKAKGARKILIICKASLRGNWEREIHRCAPEWTCQVLGGTRPFETFAQAVIINFDLLAAWADSLIADGFDCLIVDESHYVKSLGTRTKPVQRTVAALKISEDIRRRRGTVLLLTGTPLLNRPVELVTQLMMIGRLQEVTPRPRQGYTDRDWEYSFKFSYCGPTYNGHGWEFKGSSNLDLLNNRLRGTCYVRRLRNEVLDMNETRRITVPLSLNGALDTYRHTETHFQAKREESYWLELLNELRKQAGHAKVDEAVAWVKDFIEENPGKKLVVWGWHIPVQEGVAKALNKAGITTELLRSYEPGSKQMMAAIDRFNLGDSQVIVCSLQGHREGHTLVGTGHNVTDALFVEQPWHPGAVSQAEDRINRIGQEADNVFAHTLVATDTVDEWLADLIAEKWDVFKAAANGTIPESEEVSVRDILIERLKAKLGDHKPEGTI